MRCSLSALAHLATQICHQCLGGDVIALKGPLGSGKTTFVKAFCQAAGIPADSVSSPTFVIHHLYEAPGAKFRVVSHFDLYRLKSETELESIGFEEYVWGDGVSLIEWPQVAENQLPPDRLEIELSHCDDPEQREIRLRPVGTWSQRLDQV